MTDLEKKDFVLHEDGILQEIRYFRRHTDVALNLGLLVDTSGSQVLLLEEERNAGSLFFRSVLRQDSDLGFVMTFDREVELLQDFTSSVDDLEGALARMVPPGSEPARRSGRRTRPPSTALYDAVFLAAHELFRQRDGRKVAVIVSDGHDFGSIKSVDQAIHAAQASDVIVFAILYVAPGFASSAYADPGMGRRMLSRVAGETGGKLFEVGPDLYLESVFEAIDVEVRSQYSIGYTPKRGPEASRVPNDQAGLQAWRARCPGT